MMVTTGRFFLLCCWMLVAAAGASKVAAHRPLEEAKRLTGVVATTTTQQLLQQVHSQELEEDAVVVSDASTLRRQLQANDHDDGGGGDDKNEPNDSNENDKPTTEEEAEDEDDEPNEADMPPSTMKNANDPEEKEANDYVGNEVEEEEEGDEETQENEDHDDIKNPDDEEEEQIQDEGSGEQGEEQEENQWSGEAPPLPTAPEGDDYTNPQNPRPVKFQRPGADKARTYRKDSLTPELRAKIQKQLDEKQQAARRDRRGFLNKNIVEQQKQQQQPPLRRPGQGKAAAGAMTMPENPSEGATDTMRAYQPGTVEYKQHREEVLKRVELTNGKRARVALQLKLDDIDKRRAALNSTTNSIVLISDRGPTTANNKGRYTPFTKALPKAKFVEKVPVVKRLVKKMGYEEALMLDTTLSFLQGLRYGVYKASGPLTLTKKQALVEWFELLSVSLPQEWGIHDILDDLSDNISAISQKEESLAKLVNKHKPSRTTWSPACSKQQGKSSSSAMSGFNCGFWKLLHVSTVGLAEHRGGKSLIESGIRNAKTTRTFTPKEAAETLKNYIQHFYLCSDCAKKFVAEYNDCTLFSRCNRLADEASVTTDADWKEVGKWLWEVHNHISIKALQERKEIEKKRNGMARSPTGQFDIIAALWPTVDMCTQCFNGDGSWNEDAVFLYLERTFWPPSILDPQSARLLKFEDEYSAQGSGFTMILAFVGLILVVVMRQSLSKKSIDQTILMARKAMITKGSIGAKKRAV
jgi:Erv1 / Alr family